MKDRSMPLHVCIKATHEENFIKDLKYSTQELSMNPHADIEDWVLNMKNINTQMYHRQISEHQWLK